MSFGPLEIIILVVIVALVFGAKRLPELGSGIGGAIRGFGKAIKGEDEEQRPELEPPEAEAPKSSDASSSRSAP